MSSGIKNIFSAISTFWHVRGAPQAFKHQQRNPAEHFYAFKHQQLNRDSRNSPEQPKTELTKLTKLFIMRLTLSSAVAFVEFAPSGSLGGVFFGRYFRDLFNDDLCPRVLRV